MTAPIEDHALVLAARQGSQDAYRTIVERYSARLYEVVLRIVKERADAEEVVQDAFFRAWRNLDRFKFDSALYTWLYRIAVNAAVDLAKKRRRRVARSLDAGEVPMHEGLPGNSPEPDANLRRSEAIEWVRAAVAALPEPFHSILVMREYGDLSYEQLSEVLSVPKGTVESRLFRARQKMRDWLQSKLGPEGLADMLPDEA
ncbi:MAG: sigma-70 family RNA polymerase sigma factor [Planctomycetes bacterium]|nr:sigma-70 family RNA polymerase sigma factor [Planctomycetota bacterium]